MTITYPLSMPSSPAPRSLTLGKLTAVAVSRSPFTYQAQVQRFSGQAWAATVTLPVLSSDQARDWSGFFSALNGPEGTFLFAIPDRKTARGVATGTPLVNGGSQTGATLVTDGWTPSQTNILRRGDLINLGSGTSLRLYEITQDVNSDGSGNATLDIWPRLRSSPGDNNAITVANCQALMRLSSMPPEESDLKQFSINFSCQEAI